VAARGTEIDARVVRLMARLYAGGAGSETVGKRFGVSAPTALRYLRLAGVTIRPSNQSATVRNAVGARRKRAVELYRAGTAIAEIARELGVTRGTVVDRYLKREGVVVPLGPPPKPLDVQLITRLYAGGGESTRAIAARLGVCAATVEQRLRAAGVEIRPGTTSGVVRAAICARRARVATLYRARANIVAEIARELGVAPYIVRSDLRAAGLTPPRGKRKTGEHQRSATAKQHGRESTYVNHRCRCQRCRDAATEARRLRGLGFTASAEPMLSSDASAAAAAPPPAGAPPAPRAPRSRTEGRGSRSH